MKLIIDAEINIHKRNAKSVFPQRMQKFETIMGR